MPEYRKIIERTEQPIGDIALIKLDQPVRNLPFVPIATQVGNFVGQEATIYGFGIPKTFDPNGDAPSPSPNMLQGKITIVDVKNCSETYTHMPKDEQSNKQYVCAFGKQPACRVSP
jgi:Trypsin